MCVCVLGRDGQEILPFRVSRAYISNPIVSVWRNEMKSSSSSKEKMRPSSLAKKNSLAQPRAPSSRIPKETAGQFRFDAPPHHHHQQFLHEVFVWGSENLLNAASAPR